MKKVAGTEIVSDVVVVGYGGAGATSAITAHDHGARVIILEKMPAGGGNTRISAGSVLSPTGMEAVQHIKALCGGVTEREMIETYVANAIKNEAWVREMGGEVEYTAPLGTCYPYVPPPIGAWWPNVVAPESINRFRVKGKGDWGGERLWQFLASNVERRGIRIMTSTPAKELITNDKDEVIGVIAEREGVRISLKAKRAVILTCGGFENNEDMKQTFLPCQPFYIFGNLGNTGDGIRMVQKVGAALWHMNIAEGYLGFKTPEHKAAFSIRMLDNNFIYVDRYGRRFANETGLELHDAWRAVSPFDSSRLGYPRIPSYAIFDEVIRRKGALEPHIYGSNRDYVWSSDNSKEVAKGWIKRGETIGELARQIATDESLEDTVTKYNEYCKLGRDPDFDRSRETLAPIQSSPYYAIPLWPCLLNTQGGPRHDKEARVLNYEGKPVPRLYAAGELGSLWGVLYEGGGNIAECLVFGRIAGKNAAAEKPW